MAVFETVLRSDLTKPVNVIKLAGNLFSADNGGNKISVEVFDNGSPVTLSGNVTGYIVRADNATVTISGELSNNKASIILPTSAYAVVGQVSIVVKVGATTVGACTSYVYRTTTDTIVDPAHVVPSLDELLAKIADCEAATAAAMKVANVTVSAEAASGSTPDAILSETGSGESAHKHITFKLVPGTDGTSPTVVVSAITGGHQVVITDAQGDHTFNVMDGTDGVDGYVYVRWAANQPTQDSDMSTTPNDWMGIYSGSSATAPTAYTSYQWYKVKGETGTMENTYGNTIEMTPNDSTKLNAAIDSKADQGTVAYVETTDTASRAYTTGQYVIWKGTLCTAASDIAIGDTLSASNMTAVQVGIGNALDSKKVDKDQGVANAGKALGINAQGMVEPVPFSMADMTGATASTAGTHGLVPAPAAGEQDSYLRGDGTWQLPPGSRPITVALDTVTNTSGSYTHTTYTADVVASMKAIQIECSNPDAFNDSITIVVSDGSITLECDDVAGTSDVSVVVMKQAWSGDPPAVTSTEFDILAGRIGTLSNLTTTEKANLVGAVNEVNDKIANLKGTVLFTGSATSTGTLSDLITNYEYVDIYYGNSDGYNDCKRLYNNYSVTGTSFWLGTYNGSKGYFKTARLMFDSDGDSFTVDRQYGAEIQSTVTFAALTNAITIRQIIGYK